MTTSTGSLSFNQIYKEYFALVRKYITMRIKNSEIAEELIEDVFIKVSQNLHTYNVQKGQFNTWLCNIAKNILIDHYRKKVLDTTPLEVRSDKYRSNEDDDRCHILPIPTKDRSPLEAMISNETVYNVQEAMAQLTDLQRELLTMYAIDDKSYEEIAAEMGMPMGTVKGTLFNARTRLKEILGSHPVLA